MEDILKQYREMSEVDLNKIQSQWAIGSNIEFLLNSYIDPVNGEYVMFIANTQELVSKVEFGSDFTIQPLFTGEEVNDDRIARILNRWKFKMVTDPPSIYPSGAFQKNLSVEDGRHRIKATYFLQCQQIPVAIHKSGIVNAQKILCLRKT